MRPYVTVIAIQLPIFHAFQTCSSNCCPFFCLADVCEKVMWQHLRLPIIVFRPLMHRFASFLFILIVDLLEVVSLLQYNEDLSYKARLEPCKV